MNSNSRTERRLSTRCIANCQCWIEQESVTLFGMVTNLSTDGLFLHTLPIIKRNTEIDIRITLQDSGDLLARGRVAWISNPRIPAKEGYPQSNIPGLGIKFEYFKEGGKLLPEYIARRSTPPPPMRKKNLSF